MTPARTPFPTLWDSTMIAAARSCGRKAELAYFEHWKPKAESVHLVAGKAFASGIEVARRAYFIDGRTPEDAVALGLGAAMKAYGTFEPPEDSAKTCERTLGALEFYFEKYPLGVDKAEPITVGPQRGIEFSFAEPLPVAHPVSGEPLIYCGRADMIAHFANGIYTFDEKTTSSLGPTWSRQWGLRSLFTGYTWAARRVGIETAGVIVRGVSILKTKYDTQQAITNRAQWEVDRWLEQVCVDLAGMIEQWQRGRFNYNLDHACTEYGGCSFAQICASPTPDEWLPMYFDRRVWNPLLREETPLLDSPAMGLASGSMTPVVSQ